MVGGYLDVVRAFAVETDHQADCVHAAANVVAFTATDRVLRGLIPRAREAT